MKNFFTKYNFLWVLYFIYTASFQLYAVIRFLLNSSYRTTFGIWDLVLAPLYIFSLYVFVFRKKVLAPVLWKVILLIVLLDIPMTIVRSMFGDPVTIYPASFNQAFVMFPVFKFYLSAVTLVSIFAKGAPLYYALASMAFPKFSISFTLYPNLSIKQNTSPKRFYAIFLLGFIAKCIILIPAGIALMAISIAAFFMQIINSFVVLAKGQIWEPSFNMTVWATTMYANIQAYFYGLTDKYPSLGKKIEDSNVLFNFEKPKTSLRIFAIPIIGFFLRYIISLPFITYAGYIMIAAWIGTVIASFPVFFKKKYPESVHEMMSDALRLYASYRLYFAGMTDKYPSFAISLNHPVKKFLLVGFVLLYVGGATLVAASLNSTFQNISRNQANIAASIPESEFKQQFITSCEKEPALHSFCTCTWNALKEKNSYQNIVQMSLSYMKTQKMPVPFTSAINSCRQYLPLPN